MDWIQLGSEYGFGWISERRANGWFAESVRLMGNENWASLGGNPQRQIATIEAAWRALSYGYQCCDLSPWAEPSYRAEVLRAYGRGRLGRIGGERGYGAEYWLNAAGIGWSEQQERDSDAYALANPGHDYERVEVGDFGGRFARRIYEEYSRLNPGNTVGAYTLIVQCALNQAGGLSTRCVNGPDGVAGSDCDFAFRSPSCTAPLFQPSIWGPQCMAWRHPAWGTKVILPPMLGGGVADIVTQVALSCVARGARAVLEDGYKNAALLNLATGHRLGLLPDELDELIRTSAHAGDTLTHYNGNGPRSHEVDVLFAALEVSTALVAGITTAANQAWLGAVYGILIGTADMFFNLVGEPSIVVTDQFGQIEPTYQTWRVSGSPGIGPTTQPRQTVPDPPTASGAHIFIPALLGTFATTPGAPVVTHPALINLPAMLPSIEGGYNLLPAGTPSPTFEEMQPNTPPPDESSGLMTTVKVVGVVGVVAGAIGSVVALVRSK